MTDLKDKALKAAELNDEDLDDVAGGINVEAMSQVSSLSNDSKAKSYDNKVRSIEKAADLNNKSKIAEMEKAAEADKGAVLKDLSIAKAAEANKFL